MAAGRFAVASVLLVVLAAVNAQGPNDPFDKPTETEAFNYLGFLLRAGPHSHAITKDQAVDPSGSDPAGLCFARWNGDHSIYHGTKFEGKEPWDANKINSGSFFTTTQDYAQYHMTSEYYFVGGGGKKEDFTLAVPAGMTGQHSIVREYKLASTASPALPDLLYACGLTFQGVTGGVMMPTDAGFTAWMTEISKPAPKGAPKKKPPAENVIAAKWFAAEWGTLPDPHIRGYIQRRNLVGSELEAQLAACQWRKAGTAGAFDGKYAGWAGMGPNQNAFHADQVRLAYDELILMGVPNGHISDSKAEIDVSPDATVGRIKAWMDGSAGADSKIDTTAYGLDFAAYLPFDRASTADESSSISQARYKHLRLKLMRDVESSAASATAGPPKPGALKPEHKSIVAVHPAPTAVKALAATIADLHVLNDLLLDMIQARTGSAPASGCWAKLCGAKPLQIAMGDLRELVTKSKVSSLSGAEIGKLRDAADSLLKAFKYSAPAKFRQLHTKRRPRRNGGRNPLRIINNRVGNGGSSLRP